MTRLEGYEILDVLAEGDTRLLLRARPAGGDPVVVKLLTADPPTADELARLTHECDIAAELPGDVVVRPLRVERFGHRAGLVMADDGGVPLVDMIPAGGLETGTFLRLAYALARALGRVHEAGIVHRDVKPANAVVDPHTGAVRLVDFGLATRLPRVAVDADPPTWLEGTLAYMAPEQTGRLNRSVDHRSDLYGLGVTLYQMLGGRLPFTAHDPLELVHHHLATTPDSPAEVRPGVPATLSAIVMRLLAKEPEDRYQSAAGIAADLDACLAHWLAHGSVPDLSPGAADSPARFTIPERVFGRDNEIAELDRIITEIATGASLLVLLSGPAGIGKTALAAEVGPSLTAHRFLAVSGKFDQFTADVPYASFVAALRGLIRQLLAGSPAEVATWRSRITEALGPNLGVVAEVIPDLHLIVGEVPPATPVGPLETQNRFNLVFRDFVGLFADAEHPLLIFLDDLHWADVASLRLIATLLSEPHLHHLLLLGAYRPGEVSQSHPLTVVLDGLDPGLVRMLEVAPLELSSATGLVTATVRAAAPDLAAYLHDRTGGNPFFLRQVLSSLAHDRLLRPVPGRWTYDIDDVKAHPLPDDVIEFMVGKLSALPAETQRVLQVASVIGSEFDIATLAALVDLPASAVAEGLWPGLVAGLVLSHRGTGFRFLHDRVQQASHSTIPVGDLPALHLQVGRLLREQSPDGESLFEILRHLNAASDLILDAPARLDLAHLNVQGAARASASTAFASAEALLATAAELLGHDAWDAAYDLNLRAHLLRGQALGMLGRIEEAESGLLAAAGAARTDADFLTVAEVRAEMLTCAGHTGRAYAVAKDALPRAGVVFPRTADEVTAQIAAALGRLIRPDLANELLSLGAAGAEAEQVARIITQAMVCGFFAEPTEAALLACIGTEHALRCGISPASTMSIAMLTIIGMKARQISFSETLWEACAALTARADSPVTQVRAALTALAMGSSWSTAPEDCDRRITEGFLASQASGDLQFAAHSLVIQFLFTAAHGRDCPAMVEQARRWIDHGARFLPSYVDLGRVMLACAARLTGADADATDAHTVADEYERMGAHGLAAQALMGATFFEVLLGDDGAAQRHAVRAQPGYLAGAGGSSVWALFYEVGAAVAAARAAATAPAPTRDDLLAHADAMRDRLTDYAALPPFKFACFAGIATAELYLATEDFEAAGAAYLGAIQDAARAGNLLAEAWATELLGRLHLELGREFGTAYVGEARDLFLRCGARGKVELLEAEFPQLRRPQFVEASRVTSTSTSTTHGGPSLDLATVVKAAQAISSETAYDRVVERLVAISVENAGAERGCFVPAGGDDLGYPDIEGYPGEHAPASVVAYVARTREAIVIADVTSDEAFARDPYVITRQPRSVAAGPIVRQGRLLGVLYLENTLLAGVFTPERLELLRLLVAQMAIALDNARLYSRLEEEVADRTRDLSASLADLRAAQARMVETEKLAALGGLVAGVAHEVNTPIGVAVTAASHLADRTREFAAAYASGPVRRSDLTRLTATVREAERLITHNLGRATDLVASFKQVAVDQSSEHRRSFAVGEYLDDIVASLQPSFKHAQHGVRIACDRELVLDSYPGALAQVVTNLVLNSVAHAYPDGRSGNLGIEVTGDGDHLRLAYADDGCGIGEDLLGRIFEPFFTTSRAEGGSGLGLHIVHTLVTQRLGGSIQVVSSPGSGARFVLRIPRIAPDAVGGAA